MIGDSRAFELPLRTPMETARGTISSRRGFLLRVAADSGEGATGVGEAAPLPGWTEPIEDCEGALDRALERLPGEGREAALAETRGTPAARHGLSLALTDLDAKRAGQPLYRHLQESDRGGTVESVPVNATLGDAPVEETAATATEAASAGFRTLKIKVGARSIEEDARRLHGVREAVGAAVRLRADANGAWSRAKARRAIEAFPDVAYLEQPLAPSDLAGHATLREHAPVALDESLSVYSVERILEAGAADVLVLKPMVLGGVDRAASAARVAWNAGVDPVVTTTIDGVVARVGAVHLAAGIGGDRACGLATADVLEEDLASDPATVEAGEISVPQGPGHGVSVEWT